MSAPEETPPVENPTNTPAQEAVPDPNAALSAAVEELIRFNQTQQETPRIVISVIQPAFFEDTKENADPTT